MKFTQRILPISLFTFGALCACQNPNGDTLHLSSSTALDAPNPSAPLEQRAARWLQQWSEDSLTTMAQIPEKRDARTGLTLEWVAGPLVGETQAQRFVQIKDEWRRNLNVEISVQGERQRIRLGDPAKAPIAYNDRPIHLVDHLKYQSLTAMAEAGLTSASLPVQPWSDSYWPLYQGVLGARYANQDFLSASSYDWSKFRDFVEKLFPAKLFVESGDQKKIDDLSPAEKYDLLIGSEANWAFTEKNWQEGEYYYRQYGKVEPWMGICHGWAAAAYMLKRPTKSVVTKAYNSRTELTFYPSDSKALASYLWSQAAGHVRFIGGRCNENQPEVDEVGRVKLSHCFDTNPGTWHVSVVNQIGANKRSVIMDATYDYEVWNQPIQQYSYVYFNPITRKTTNQIKKAIVPRDEFAKHDRFKQHRTGPFTYVVGVAMDVDYMVETSPTHKPSDSPAFDGVNQVTYIYDLELDRDYNILGGEWYTNIHPDFLWTPTPESRATTPYDARLTGEWNTHKPLPKDWANAAQRAVSGQQSLPLAHIVEGLIAAAQGQR